ncbi:hypothetical protein B0H14DRAFT_3492000 [Mycena olivaceomarginata]|nr:hypothetical protein B0H14DRAFT_3492000 [Mycena olivaceomarginata]
MRPLPDLPVWISPSTMSNHPGYTWRRVAQFCDVPDILVLLRLSKAIYSFLVHRLYQDISVGRSARRMVHTLANNKRLPPMVRAAVRSSFVLELQPSPPALSRLWYLMITPRIPLSTDVIPLIRFRLTFFGSISTVDPAWPHLLASQDRLQKLPVLRSVKGCPGDLASWAFDRPSLDAMWFLGGFLDPMDIDKLTVCTSRLRSLRISAPDFVSFARANPATVSTLCHLVLDEDVTWSDFTLISDQKGLGDSSLASACALIENNERCFRRLESIFLVCGTIATDRSHRRLLSRDDAVCFLKFMSPYFSSPALRIFRFSATDGYASCIGWDEDVLHYSSRSRAPAFLAYYNELFP